MNKLLRKLYLLLSYRSKFFVDTLKPIKIVNTPINDNIKYGILKYDNEPSICNKTKEIDKEDENYKPLVNC